jgi:hypothetical protein
MNPKELMRRYFLSFMILAFVFVLSAQEAGKFRVGFNLEAGSPSIGMGTQGIDVDLRYNFNDHFNFGASLGIQDLSKDLFLNTDNSSRGVNSSCSSLLFHSDYYFFNSTTEFLPFLGGGLGVFGLTNVAFNGNPEPNPDGYTRDYKLGALLRGGFEYKKFRFAYEQNFIPSSVLVNTKGENAGTYSNNFSNFSIGYYIGGGKLRSVHDTIPFLNLRDFSLHQLSFSNLHSTLLGKQSLASYHRDSAKNVNAKLYTIASISEGGIPAAGIRYRPSRQFSSDLELGILPADGGGFLLNWSLNYHVPKCAGLITGLTYSRFFLIFDVNKLEPHGSEDDMVSPWVGYLFPSVFYTPINCTLRLGGLYLPYQNAFIPIPYFYLGVGVPLGI